ncbi:MAG: hypothetical protein VX737_02400 [Pseudomonadota bacterium]|nr:hypothetical protein [Pseudomonadota bacterium]
MLSFRVFVVILSFSYLMASGAESESGAQVLKYDIFEDDSSEDEVSSNTEEDDSDGAETTNYDDGELEYIEDSEQENEKSNPVNVDRYLDPIEGTFDSNMYFEYSARLGSNGMPNGDSNYLSFFVSNFHWVAQAIHNISEDFAVRPSIKLAIVSAPDINETISQKTPGANLQLREYVMHFISKKYGVFTFGRSRSFDRMATDFLALDSGVNNKFYQDVSGVRMYNKADDSYMGVVAKGNGSFNWSNPGPEGDGLRLWGVQKALEVFDGVAYALPYNSWLFQLAYANTPGDFTDKYFQMGLRYTYDVLWARWSMLGMYASSWPFGCQTVSTNELSSGSGDWAVCQATGQDQPSPYKEILLGSKFSLGYVDGSLSYKLLFDSDSQAQAVGFSAGHIQNYYGGLNYTFMDAFEFGPLSIGLGLIKQNKFASLVDQSSGGPYTKTTTPALSVEDSHSWGVLFSAKQKIGRNSGLRFYVEKLGFSAIKTDGSLKIKASPIRVASLSFYTNIDQWSFTK